MSPPRLAFGTRATIAPSRSDPVLGVPSIGVASEGLVFIDRTNAPWKVTNVADASGGPEAIGSLLTWFDPHVRPRAVLRERRIAGLRSTAKLANGAWTYEVLGETLGTGTVLRPESAMTVGPGKPQHRRSQRRRGPGPLYVLPARSFRCVA
ncbi:MAG: hypothetical protein KF705_12440 [Phycisphaeraceae bacterium]|nr:hypothetical protein [Phycisphaeraceae bacterium]